LIGPQEELRGRTGYTPRVFYLESKAEGEVEKFGFYNNKLKNKQTEGTCEKQTNRGV